MASDLTITSATSDFGRWMSRFVKMDLEDLRYKYAQMAEDYSAFNLQHRLEGMESQLS
jgi:hypothetical protein